MIITQGQVANSYNKIGQFYSFNRRKRSQILYGTIPQQKSMQYSGCPNAIDPTIVFYVTLRCMNDCLILLYLVWIFEKRFGKRNDKGR